MRDRVENIRSRARGDVDRGGCTPSQAAPVDDDRPVSTAGAPVRPTPPDDEPLPSERPIRSQNPNEIPVGTEFDVRLQNALSSKTAQVEDRFEATTMVDLRDERGRVIVPAGSLMRGVVSSVNKATRTDRKGSLTVAFDRVTINGRSYPIRATVTQALESEGIMGEKEKIGIGAGAGAILGAILGGAKGALAGILIGGGGTIAATEGKDVELPPGRCFASGWIRRSRCSAESRRNSQRRCRIGSVGADRVSAQCLASLRSCLSRPSCLSCPL